jgi:predicted AlkP superfamily phosphohydrolase/phosphomutase
MAATARKVFVLGLDGATFDIVNRLTARGELPAFTRLRQEGVWGPLESVPNMRSAAAWTSFQTGTNPGQHGIFEFYDFLPGPYRIRFINAGARAGESLWHILSRHGRKVGVINLPMTYPAETVNGFLVAGLDCPGTRSKGFTYPEGLAGELHRAAGRYIIEPGLTGSVVGGRMAEAVALLRAGFDQKMRVTRFLMRSQPWDCFVLVLRSLDAVQHLFWKYMDARHPQYDPAAAQLHGSVIDDAYRMIDRYLGELIDGLEPDTALIVVSDHGFGRKHPAGTQLNAWLASQGLLAYRKAGTGASSGWLSASYRRLTGATSRRTKEWLWRMLPDLRDTVHSRLCFANIDWTRTRAYSDGLFPNIRINLKGREGRGTVAAGREYDDLMDILVPRLRELQDSLTGDEIVQDVLRKEDIYHGPWVHKAPDVLVRWREDVVISGIQMPQAGPASAVSAPPLPGEDASVISGDHHLNGVFLARGPDFCRGKELAGARIVDLAPTILYYLKLPIPDGMDGHSLVKGFDDVFVAANPPLFDRSVRTQPATSAAYDSDDEEAVRQRLRDLGYVE